MDVQNTAVFGRCQRCGGTLTSDHKCPLGADDLRQALTGHNIRKQISEQAKALKQRQRIADVRAAIQVERNFQDSKWGSIEQSPHSIAEWILIAEAELAEAKQAVIKGGTDRNSVRSEIVQTIAVLHACLEQHGTQDDHGGRAL